MFPRWSVLHLARIHNQSASTLYVGGDGGRGRKGLWGLSVEHSKDLHGGRQGLMGEVHLSVVKAVWLMCGMGHLHRRGGLCSQPPRGTDGGPSAVSAACPRGSLCLFISMLHFRSRLLLIFPHYPRRQSQIGIWSTSERMCTNPPLFGCWTFWYCLPVVARNEFVFTYSVM